MPFAMKAQPCPVCRYNLDAATMVGDRPEFMPMPGDFSICIRCHFVLRWRLIEGALRLAKVSEKQDRAEAIATFRAAFPGARVSEALAVHVDDPSKEAFMSV